MIKLKKLLEENVLSEMACISQTQSGIPFKLWLGQHNGSKHFQPYVKILDNTQELASISIGNPDVVLAGSTDKISSKNLKKIKEFISLNKDTLLYYYYHYSEHGFNSNIDLYQRLQKI